MSDFEIGLIFSLATILFGIICFFFFLNIIKEFKKNKYNPVKDKDETNYEKGSGISTFINSYLGVAIGIILIIFGFYVLFSSISTF